MSIPEEISTLEGELSSASEPASQASIINEILKKYHLIKRKEGAAYIPRLKALAEEMDSDEYRAHSHLHTAMFHHMAKNYTAGMEAAEAAIAAFKKIDHKTGLAQTYNTMGVIYNTQGKFPQALDFFLKGLKLHEETGNLKGIATGYHNIGSIYLSQGNQAAALEYNLKAAEIREEIEDYNGLSSTYTNIGAMYNLAGDADKALQYHMKALEMMEAMGNKDIAGFALVNIGAIHSDRGEHDLALEFFLKALKNAEEIGDKKLMAGAYNNIGMVYMHLSDYAKALFYFNMGLDTSREAGLRDMARDSLNGLYQLNKAKGDVLAALDYHEQYIQAKEEIITAGMAQKMADMQFRHDIERKEKEVEIERLRNTELKEAKDKSDTLLLNILPAEIAEELKTNGTSEARLYDNVTVLFTDFKNFTSMSERLSPKELIDELHACFSAFDHILEGYGIEKIKTVGDAYLAASGIPLANENHAANVVQAAVEIRNYMLQRKIQRGETTFEIRIGIHSGPVIAGIVGSKKFAYDIWGDTVNTAARMEQNSEPGRINISGDTHALVKGLFPCSYRGKIDAKNKGLIDMYFVQ